MRQPLAWSASRLQTRSGGFIILLNELVAFLTDA